MLLSSFTGLLSQDTQSIMARIEQSKGNKRINLIASLPDYPSDIPGQQLLVWGQELLASARKTNIKTREIQALKLIALGYSHIGEHAKSLEHYFLSRNLSKETGNLMTEAQSTSEIGNLFYFAFNDFYQAIEYYGKAEALYRSLKDDFGVIKHQNNRAEVYTKVGEYTQAVNLYTEALAKLEKMGKLQDSARFVVYLNLSRASAYMSNLDIADDYKKKAENLLAEIRDPWREAQFWNLQSNLLELRGNYLEAMDAIIRTHEMMQPGLSHQSELGTARVVMSNKIQMGQLALKLEKFDDASTYLTEAEALYPKSQDRYKYSHLLLNKARLLHRQGKLEAAINQALINADHCHTFHFLLEQKEVYGHLSQLYHQQGNLERAMYFAQMRTKLEEEKLQPNIPADITSIIMKYEQGRLRQQMGKLKWNNVLNLFVMGFFLLLLLLISLRTIRKIKKHGLEELKRVEFRHSKDLENLQDQLMAFKDKKSGIHVEKAEDLVKKLILLVEEEELYKDCNITLEVLADRLDVNRTYLSQAVNSLWGNNLSDFINYFRIKEARQLLLQPSSQSKSFLTIAFEVGFNSKSTFNRVFKEKTGLTPKQYVQIKRKNGSPLKCVGKLI